MFIYSVLTFSSEIATRTTFPGDAVKPASRIRGTSNGSWIRIYINRQSVVVSSSRLLIIVVIIEDKLEREGETEAK